MAPIDFTANVRNRVHQLFAELRFGVGECRETILIRNGSYCGRRFDVEAGSAIWFVEEDQLKLINADGRVVRVVDRATDAVRELRSAA